MAQQMNGRPNPNGPQTSFGYNQPQGQQMSPQFQPPPTYKPSFQQSQPIPTSAIPGRMVYDLKDIAPNEVPLDGSFGLFPTVDRSRIFALYWDGIEGIKYDTYVLQQPNEASPQQQPDEMAAIKDQLDRIEKQLTRQTKAIYSKPKTDQNGSK